MDAMDEQRPMVNKWGVYNNDNINIKSTSVQL